MSLQDRYEEERRSRIMAEEKLQSIVDAVLSDEAFEEAMHYNPLVQSIATIAVKRYQRKTELDKQPPDYRAEYEAEWS